ncbi:PREDICTED: F-box/LRR-repeat [Prunus dulcis]|uniref:PREDICTED: F-box/LRR-repeat n=1 Tax=Prunus dulcis TaxID=3755 RepID=A0A5E4FKT5_PRUDU|nr:PREDICTED: F-box/LRR-repeat [Prunus dulcis]
MERKNHNLVATASCEGEGGGCRERMTDDRLSNLPDHIAHRILSFLTTYDLARLSCVSKCCRGFCQSTPFLNFSRDDGMAAADTCGRHQRLLNSLERFLLLRGDHKVQRFHFVWSRNQRSSLSCICRDVYFRVMSWVHKAVKCNVEEVDLDLFGLDDPILDFPSSIFLCESLKSLSVHMERLILKAPSVSFSSNLKDLELSGAFIADEEGFFKWISCSCKCIQILRLAYPRGIKNLNIESSSLESFTLFDPQHDLDTLNISCENLQLSISLKAGSPSITPLNIFAPNLKKLWWRGNLMNHPNLGKFQNLESAEKCGFDMGYWKLENLAFIHELKYFTIELSDGSNGVKLAKYILEWAPKLKSVVLICSPQNLEEVKRKLAKCKMISKAAIFFKERRGKPNKDSSLIELSNRADGVKLAKYILGCAQKSEKVDIICSPQNLEEFERKLERAKVISNAAIAFVERPKT